tara:strand:- start:420 stop:710 length:291 start_codon:yes stop_codon:yes gene_type:complete
MEKEELLKFFQEKNELINDNKSFTSLNLKCINIFGFVVSNNKEDECSFEIKSIKSLIDAVKEYYCKTNIDYKTFIKYSSDFNRESNLFVTPELLVM